MRLEASAKARAVGLTLTAAYLGFVGWVLLRPHCVAWVPAPNLSPLSTIRADLRMGPGEATRRIGEGLGLLAPLGVLLPLSGGRFVASGLASFVRTVFATLMISMGFEFTQTLVPGQLFDVDAILLNTVGVAATHLLVVPATRRRLLRRWDGQRLAAFPDVSEHATRGAGPGPDHPTDPVAGRVIGSAGTAAGTSWSVPRQGADHAVRPDPAVPPAVSPARSRPPAARRAAR